MHNFKVNLVAAMYSIHSDKRLSFLYARRLVTPVLLYVRALIGEEHTTRASEKGSLVNTTLLRIKAARVVLSATPVKVKIIIP